MDKITIHCSDCNPGILGAESLLFNRHKITKIFTWPLGYIPRIEESHSNSHFTELLETIKQYKKIDINLIAHTSCDHMKYIEFFNIKDAQRIKQSIINLQTINCKNLQSHLINLGLNLKDFTINLHIYDEKTRSLCNIDEAEIKAYIDPLKRVEEENKKAGSR